MTRSRTTIARTKKNNNRISSKAMSDDDKRVNQTRGSSRQRRQLCIENKSNKTVQELNKKKYNSMQQIDLA